MFFCFVWSVLFVCCVLRSFALFYLCLLICFLCVALFCLFVRLFVWFVLSFCVVVVFCVVLLLCGVVFVLFINVVCLLVLVVFTVVGFMVESADRLRSRQCRARALKRKWNNRRAIG